MAPGEKDAAILTGSGIYGGMDGIAARRRQTGGPALGEIRPGRFSVETAEEFAVKLVAEFTEGNFNGSRMAAHRRRKNPARSLEPGGKLLLFAG
jgi:hypothetical protein